MFARFRPAPFAVSLLVHGTILVWVASGPVRNESKSLYAREIAPHASKVVWYDFRQKLPDVSPTAKQPSATPPRAEVKIASQEIVAGSTHAPHARQFVWQPAPKLELNKDLQSPNVLALHTPPVEPPPKPKLFVPPPEAPKPTPEPTAVASPPKLAAAVPARTPLPTPIKKFQMPEIKPAVKPVPKLDAPPEIRPAQNLGVLANAPTVKVPRLPARTFVAPGSLHPAEKAAPVLPAPPSVAAAANTGTAPQALGSVPVAAARRAFVPPTASGKPSAFGAPVPDAPALPTAASDAAVSMAIVGLNPTAGAPAPVPEGSRNAQFSAGPTERKTGGAAGSVDGALLSVPGLLIRNANPDDKPTLTARASPTSSANLSAAVRRSLPDAVVTGAHPAAALRVSSAPDSFLNGRDTYQMMVQMPNTTSYTGTWMIWFAEREHVPGAVASLNPPVPLRKVDPKYYPAAMAERVEGIVRLTGVIHADGHVGAVTVLMHLDDRLDQSSEEAISKWEFAPALRNGQPVEVDAVFEIPFRLAPKIPK